MATRYLQPVAADDEAATSLVNIWLGRNEEEGALQEERLELRADGTFEHRLVHKLTVSGDATGKQAHGFWKVHRVRHEGADLNADGDREIEFSVDSSNASEPPITERLVVCGTAPVLNGFQGAACRLYPSGRGQASDSAEAEAAEEETEATVPDEEVQLLAETTGLPKDRCLAALLELGKQSTGVARLEAAAAKLLDEPAPNDAARSPAEVSEANVQQLMACTGRSEQDCRCALQQYESLDAAAEILLDGEALADPSAASSSEPAAASSSAPVAQAPAQAPNPADAQRLSELTGQPLANCMAALEKAPSVDEAAALLLDGELPEAAADAAPAAAGSGAEAPEAAGPEAAEEEGLVQEGFSGEEEEVAEGEEDEAGEDSDVIEAAAGEEPTAKRRRTGEPDEPQG